MQGSEESSDEADEEAVLDQEDEEPLEIDRAHDVEPPSRYIALERRKSSRYSRKSFEDPLLGHRTSMRTHQSHWEQGGRINQKIYIVNEDLTIVISGFVTSLFGYVAYISLCVFTCGVAYLLLRWLPRWRVRVTGNHAPLKECSWAVIEVRHYATVQSAVTGAFPVDS